MKVSAIKHLAEQFDANVLIKLQQQLENEEPLEHDVPGEDEGEKLTHLLGAIWIHEQMSTNGTDFKTELRNFTARVRDSIS